MNPVLAHGQYEAGLRSRDSGAIMRDHIEDLKPAMAEFGLRFPPASRLGVEITADLALSGAREEGTS